MADKVSIVTDMILLEAFKILIITCKIKDSHNISKDFDITREDSVIFHMILVISCKTLII